jgi:hypothetical protein
VGCRPCGRMPALVLITIGEQGDAPTTVSAALKGRLRSPVKIVG